MKLRRQLALVVAILLVAAGLRLWQLGTLPPGFSNAEINSLRITEQEQAGQIVVFGRVGAESGQETLYHIIEASLSSIFGDGLILLRLPSVWIGLLTLALTYALARRLYTDRAALLALGLMAVGFWPTLLSRLVLREALVPLFVVSTLVALTYSFHIRRRVSPDPPNTATYSILGIITAGSLYAHWYGLFLAGIVTLAVAYLFLTRQQISRRAAGASAFAILISLIVVIPYAITTLRSPALSGLASLQNAMMPENVLDSVIGAAAGLFARGDTNAAFNFPGRPLVDPLTGALFVVGLVMGLRHWRRPFNVLPALAAAVGLIPALLSTHPAAFPAYVGVLPLIYLLAACPADTFLRELSATRPRLEQAAPWLLTALVVVNLAWTTADLAAWGRRADVLDVYNADRGLLAHHLDRTAADIPTVVCSPQLVDTAGQFGDVHLLDLMMHGETLPIRYVDCASGLVLAEGGTRQQLAITDLSIVARMYDHLRPWLHGREEIPVAGLPPFSVLEINAQRQVEDTIGRLLTTAPTGWAPESPGGAGPVELPARFGGNITFLGYVQAQDTPYAPGDIVPVITYWRVDGDVPPDLRIFAHVLSDPAAIVAQNQGLNVWPEALRPRDVFIQVNYIALPESIPAGSYDISVGAFQADTGARLPVFDDEQERGDRLFLHQITVTRPQESE